MDNKDWIDIKEREPKVSGIYWVKMSVGSINRKIEEMQTQFTKYENQRSHWNGAFDWNYVIAWKEL